MNGLSIFNISEEGTGPGSRFMTGKLHKHFNVLVDLREMSVVLGRPVEKEQRKERRP